MGSEAAVALREAAAQDAPAELGALRERLSPGSDRDAVLLDFLEDDLAEARGSMAMVARYLAEVEAALGDPATGRDRVVGLALGRGPLAQLDYLCGTLQDLRRRLLQVSSRIVR